MVLIILLIVNVLLIQIQHLLKLNVLSIGSNFIKPNSNTTLVKVKSIPCLSFAIIMQNSNTTLVKVKFLQSLMIYLRKYNSNTTLVKVKCARNY